mmetsp:Transcript_57558/g.158083  ORF Transcript_57558/g.158083 Transcript_57558/m.158083 type:complete len:218 (+) Transcript_57558:743-1396(+)
MRARSRSCALLVCRSALTSIHSATDTTVRCSCSAVSLTTARSKRRTNASRCSNRGSCDSLSSSCRKACPRCPSCDSTSSTRARWPTKSAAVSAAAASSVRRTRAIVSSSCATIAPSASKRASYFRSSAAASACWLCSLRASLSPDCSTPSSSLSSAAHCAAAASSASLRAAAARSAPRATWPPTSGARRVLSSSAVRALTGSVVTRSPSCAAAFVAT